MAEEVEKADLLEDAVGEGEDEEDTDISNSDVCTKYREAGKIVNLALEGLVAQAKPGAKIIDLCRFGDNVIAQKCASIYQKKVKGKVIEKGIAFPTCVSVNECVCHNSPLESDAEQPRLEAGDIVKLDVGCHIDGYISVAAHTLVVGNPPEAAESNVTGSKADVMQAAYLAGEVATKLLQPGNTNYQVTQAIAKVAQTFGVRAVMGVLGHQMKRFVIDGNKVILLREEVDQKVENQTFELNEVYSIDVAMSTGDGKPRETETRTTVFKRAVDKNYRLKMRASRYLFNEVNSKYPALPFSLRMLEDERQARMGVVECLKHELLHAYPVLYERPGDHVAHFKVTILILPSGPTRITGLSLQANVEAAERVLDPELSAIMATSTKKKKKNKKKKPASNNSETAVTGGADTSADA